MTTTGVFVDITLTTGPPSDGLVCKNSTWRTTPTTPSSFTTSSLQRWTAPRLPGGRDPRAGCLRGSRR
eukprot:2885386-Pyramimonas_sp.AAC.2